MQINLKHTLFIVPMLKLDRYMCTNSSYFTLSFSNIDFNFSEWVCSYTFNDLTKRKKKYVVSINVCF